jgi:serine kinase of HPr protein (carbohydrate metabolism regulator)
VILHAGLVAWPCGGSWEGLLIEGRSGAGKSDLALRALDLGFRLVADDRTLVFHSGGRAFGRAPAPLAGLIEARGLGVCVERRLAYCPLALVVRCAGAPQEPERLPDPLWTEILGVSLPVLSLWPFEASAPAKLRRALEHLGAEKRRAYQAPLAAEDPSGNRG